MNTHKSGSYIRGTRVPGCFDPFEMAVRAILGQQVTVKAAQTLARRVAQTFGEPIGTPFAELTHLFPSVATIAALAAPVAPPAPAAPPQSIAALAAPTAVAAPRQDAACRELHLLRQCRCGGGAGLQALERGDVQLSLAADPLEQMQKLLALPGFGPWTVNYVALRALGWPDAFPHTDYGIKKALEPLTEKQILALSETWKPWRSYATINLWNSLSHRKEPV